VFIIFFSQDLFTCACLFGSKRYKQPYCCAVVKIIPAPQKLSKFGSIPVKELQPKPINYKEKEVKKKNFKIYFLKIDYLHFDLFSLYQSHNLL
jgi:hypothetical protein